MGCGCKKKNQAVTTTTTTTQTPIEVLLAVETPTQPSEAVPTVQPTTSN